MKSTELEPNKIYIASDNFIFDSTTNKYIYISGKFFSGAFCKSLNYSYREATPEEEHWFNECLKGNRYISRKEAMKTFNGDINYEIY